MELLRWMGRMYARFVAVSVSIISAWTFAVNLVDRGWEPLVLVWILASGLAGSIGGVAYLLSLDGPERFRRRAVRVGGWAAMLFAVLLPTSLTLMLVPMVLVLVPSLFTLGRRAPEDEAVTSG